MRYRSILLLIGALPLYIQCGLERVYEGDDAGECADGADNDRDGLFDCEDDDCIGSPECTSSDTTSATTPTITVSDGPWVSLTPNPYDFGSEYIGCNKDSDFLLANIGTEILTVSDIQYESVGDQMQMWSISKDLPFDLAPESSMSLSVTFQPTVEGKETGRISVTSNDPREQVSADQSGVGVYFDWQTDQFNVSGSPPVDIIFAVDRSCSMDDDAVSLASNFSAFITQIDSVTTEWKIGVVTADNGCFNTVIDNTTANYDSLFSAAVLSNNKGVYTEALLTLVKQSLIVTTTCNADFLREASLVHAIMISDEPEQSPGTWSSLVTDIEELVGDPARLKLSAVAGDYPSGCGSADPGTGYYEAVMATGGEFLSICSNWSKNVEALANASTDGLNNYEEFELTEQPIESSITVTVNGAVWTTGWEYLPKPNAVALNEIVEAGTIVRVEYGVVSECD